MKLLLLNTSQGLKPCYDADYEERKKLRIGQEYVADIKMPRNIAFHRKYFALINCAWEYQQEKSQRHFKDNVECFRKTVEIAAGHCDTAYSLKRREWLEIPRSVAFDKMDEAGFQDLYERVKTVLFSVFLKHIPEEEFMSNLINF